MGIIYIYYSSLVKKQKILIMFVKNLFEIIRLCPTLSKTPRIESTFKNIGLSFITFSFPMTSASLDYDKYFDFICVDNNVNDAFSRRISDAIFRIRRTSPLL